MKRISFIFAACLLAKFAFSQGNPEVVENIKLARCKVDSNRFEFGWHPDAFKRDPYFKDYTKMKIRIKVIDPKTDSLVNYNPKKHQLKITPYRVTLDKENRLFGINGQIAGAWEGVMSDEFEIYIGHRVDTISKITWAPRLHVMSRDGSNATFILDTVPAFYLTDFKKFYAFRGEDKPASSEYKQILFSISSVIDEKSMLVFGLSSGYSEIFEIGKLLIKEPF